MFNALKRAIRSMVLPSSTSSTYMFQSGQTLSVNDLSDEQALNNSDIFAVINKISSDVASCNIKTTGPLEELFKRPNNLINGFTFWQTVLASLLLKGNAYVAIRELELEFIPADNVQLTLLDRSKDIVYTFHYQDGRNDESFYSKDVLHFKLLATGLQGNQYVGRSPLQSLKIEVNMQDYSNKLTLATLKNAMAPTTLLTIPEGTLDDKAKETIRKAWEKQNIGENLGRPIVLDQSTTLQRLSIDSDVANFLKNNTFSQTQIAKAFGIPDSVLNGVGDNQSSVDMLRALYISSLQQYIKPIEAELSLKFKTDVQLDIIGALDVDNSILFGGLSKIVKGLTPEQLQQILINKGVFDLKTPKEVKNIGNKDN